MRKEAVRLTLGAAGLALCLNLSALPMYEKGDPIDLRFPILTALADVMVNEQDADGRIRTYFIPEAQDDDPYAGAVRLPYGGDWYNCMASDVAALGLLLED